MTPTPAIEIAGLTKSYGDLPVLRGVDLRVPAGTVHALLGSNGAGKTTLVRILATLLRADGGTAAVVPGLTATSLDGVSGFSYPLVFLPFVSSAFVPTEGMPGPVRWFADHQPVTSIVDTLRALYAEQPVGRAGWVAVTWCVGLLVVAYALAMRTYRRRIA